MADISADCTENRVSPTSELKCIVLETPATTATSDTVDVSNWGIRKILITYLQDDAGLQVDNPAWSGTVITFPTITTGIHHLMVVGEC